ncbi:Uncharacterized protein MLTONO_0420 [Mesorhizobium loti]|nr:Uncharacterized protein MLTONO_0420 [Mesorhizobium loti]
MKPLSPFARDFLVALAESTLGMLPFGRRIGGVLLKHSGLLSSATLNVDERLRKIEVARSNLQEALEAVDELKDEAQRNQEALADLSLKLDQREREKGELDAKLSELRTLTDISATTLQSVFRVPSRASIWAERLIGFVIGVGASVVASMIYVRLP